MNLSMLSWISFNHYSVQYSFKATGCFSTKPASRGYDSYETGMNPVALLSPILGENIGQAQGSNPVVKGKLLKIGNVILQCPHAVNLSVFTAQS